MSLRWVFAPMAADPEPGQDFVISAKERNMRQLQSPTTTTSTSIPWRSAGLFAVRYGIGGVMVLAGIVVLVIVPGDMGVHGFASSIGGGLSVVLINLLYRLSISGDREREREEEARRYLDEHGVWPDDDEARVRARTRRWVLPPGVVLPEHETVGRVSAASDETDARALALVGRSAGERHR
jgi:hypothetical protein